MKNTRSAATLAVLAAVFLSLLCPSAQCAKKGQDVAPDCIVFSPQQKCISNQSSVKMDGKIANAAAVRSISINGKNLILEKSGYFRSALILNPGKNLAVLSIIKNDGSVTKIARKILRVIKYPDMEELYYGHPHWAKKIITDLATAGIIEAFPDGRFMPDDLVTRGEFATWLCRAKGILLEPVSSAKFRDVPAGHWRAPYIYAVTKKGYMGADSTDMFGIDEPLSRVDSAFAITKAVSLMSSFEAKQAATIEAYLKVLKKRMLETAVEEGYFIGVSNRFKIYDFSRDMTRAEAVNLIARIKEAKSRVNFVYDWGRGFDASSACPVNAALVLSAASTPEAVYSDGKSNVTVFAKVDTVDGLSDIVVVKVNLRQIDGPSDAVMYDDASHGDVLAGDAVFSLSFPINANTSPGYKEFLVTAVNKWGLSASSKARLWVYAKNNAPKILSSLSNPFAVKPGGSAVLAVKVYDADGGSDIESVTADLSSMGGGSKEVLFDNGTGGDVNKGDLTYMKEIKIPAVMPVGKTVIRVTVTDKSGESDKSDIKLDIL